MDAATADVEELLAIGDSVAPGASDQAPTLAWLAVDLDRVAETRRSLASVRWRRWSAVAQAILAGEPARAADLLQAMGHLPDEAYAGSKAGTGVLYPKKTALSSIDAWLRGSRPIGLLPALQKHERDLPRCALAVSLPVWVVAGGPWPQPLALLRGRLPRTNAHTLALDVHLRFRMSAKIVQPSGIAVRPASRCDDQKILAIRHIDQRSPTHLAALSANMLKHQQRRNPSHMATDATAGCPIDRGVAARQPSKDEPDRIIEEVDGGPFYGGSNHRWRLLFSIKRTVSIRHAGFRIGSAHWKDRTADRSWLLFLPGATPVLLQLAHPASKWREAPPRGRQDS